VTPGLRKDTKGGVELFTEGDGKMKRVMLPIMGLALLGSFGVGSAAMADTVAFKAQLNAASEVPPNTSAATGQAEISLDTATKVLTYTVTYSGLSGPASGAHFHGPAEAGKNAGIVVPFNFVVSPIKGTATLTDAQISDLTGGRWYVNVHTSANPGGEIRGQVVK
jgi:hypothetical protein